MAALAGGENIFNDIDPGYTNVSVEEALTRNPDAIIIADFYFSSMPENGTAVEAEATIRELLATTTAVREDNIIVPYLYLDPSVSDAEAVEFMAQQLHPDAFEQ